MMVNNLRRYHKVIFIFKNMKNLPNSSFMLWLSTGKGIFFCSINNLAWFWDRETRCFMKFFLTLRVNSVLTNWKWQHDIVLTSWPDAGLKPCKCYFCRNQKFPKQQQEIKTKFFFIISANFISRLNVTFPLSRPMFEFFLVYLPSKKIHCDECPYK